MKCEFKNNLINVKETIKLHIVLPCNFLCTQVKFEYDLHKHA